MLRKSKTLSRITETFDIFSVPKHPHLPGAMGYDLMGGQTKSLEYKGYL